MSELLQLANELSASLSWGAVTADLRTCDVGKPRAKLRYWVSAPDREKQFQKGFTSLEVLVDALAGAVIYLVDYVFDGDYSRNATSRGLADLLDRVDVALSDYYAKVEAQAGHLHKAQKVVALGYEYANDKGGRSRDWRCFTRDVRLIDGVWTARILYCLVPVRFDEAKDVWFEVKQ